MLITRYYYRDKNDYDNHIESGSITIYINKSKVKIIVSCLGKWYDYIIDEVVFDKDIGKACDLVFKKIIEKQCPSYLLYRTTVEHKNISTKNYTHRTQGWYNKNDFDYKEYRLEFE